MPDQPPHAGTADSSDSPRRGAPVTPAPPLRARWGIRLRDCVGTAAIVSLLTVGSLLPAVWGPPGDPVVLTVLGAKDDLLLAQGQLWRCLTAGWLHLSWLHLAVNLLAVVGLGVWLEVRLGTQRLVLVWLLCGAGACLASFGLRAGSAVGASGAVAGLLGCALALQLRPSDGPGSGRWAGAPEPSVRGALGLALVSAAPALLAGAGLESTDHGAHLGGLVCGLLLGAWRPRWGRPAGLTPSAGAPRLSAAGALALVLVGVGMLGTVSQVVPLRWLPRGPSRPVRSPEPGGPELRLRWPWRGRPAQGGGGALLSDGAAALATVRRLTSLPAGAGGASPWRIVRSARGATVRVAERWVSSACGVWLVRVEVPEGFAYRYADPLGEIVAGLPGGPGGGACAAGGETRAPSDSSASEALK